MKKATEKKKDNKKEKVAFRVTLRQRDYLKKKAAEMGVTISEYSRNAALQKKTERKPLASIVMVTIVAMVTDILRYVEDRYDLEEDQVLKRKVEEVWDILHLSV